MTLYISTTAVSDGQRGSGGGGGVNRARLSLSADTKINDYRKTAMALMHYEETWRQFVQQKKPPKKSAKFNKSSWVIST